MSEQFSRELPDLSGAAVRGEAVAESEPIDLRHAILEVLMNRANGMSEDHLLFYRAPGDAKRPVSMLVAELVAAVLSARAADAPSEPSEHAKFQAAYARINNSTPGGGWADLNGGADDYCEPDVQAAWLLWKSRAADALDSQPIDSRIAELEAQLAECVALSQKWVSAAGEADGRAFKAREAALDEAAEVCMRATPDRAYVRRIGEAAHYVACNKAILSLKSASSQPTDGGVRNG